MADPPPCPMCGKAHDEDERCEEPYTLRELERLDLERDPWDR